jgi:hypothetical protein
MMMLLVFLLLAAGTAASEDTCPASWTTSPGVCIWPKQKAYKTLTVAGDAHAMAAACCSACASAQGKCVSWLAYVEEKDKGHMFAKGTCILNDAEVQGQAPNGPWCVSGRGAEPHWPPAPPPVPAKKGAMNVLFFAVDDLRPEIRAFANADPSGNAIPGTVGPPLYTPAIDALAAGSLVLTKNYVQQAVCSPTRTSLLTGRRPDRTRVYDLYSNFRTVAANYTTLPVSALL